MTDTTTAPAAAPAQDTQRPSPEELANAVTLTALKLLREPFADHHISPLPKESKAQREEREQNRNMGIRCPVCHNWHHKAAVHLEYVGHAATTHRLLDADPFWNWQPLAWDDNGMPRFDASGGLWIRLTVRGVTRLGYGHADKKPGADAGAREKEVIGDALRNAAMRFGVALDLWHKGDLHGPQHEDEGTDQSGAAAAPAVKAKTQDGGPPPDAPPPADEQQQDPPAQQQRRAPPAGRPAEEVATIKPGQVKYLQSKFKQLGWTAKQIEAACKPLGIKAIDTSITLAQFDGLSKALRPSPDA